MKKFLTVLLSSTFLLNTLNAEEMPVLENDNEVKEVVEEIEMPKKIVIPKEEAIENLDKIIKENDTILVKASRGMHLEKVVEHLNK